MKKSVRGLLVAIVAVMAVFFLLNSYTGTRERELSYSDFKNQVAAANVLNVDWQGSTLAGQLADGKRYTVRAVSAETAEGAKLISLLEERNIEFKLIAPPAAQRLLPLIGVFLLPVAMIVLFYYVFIKPAQYDGAKRTTPPKGTTKERIEQLDSLLQKGLLSEDEHRALRLKILSEI
ncbi:MAG: ATP-dependent metallopeptidase FtsH/Yme1/Tma family protein [Fimbriimonadaceae bacterium]